MTVSLKRVWGALLIAISMSASAPVFATVEYMHTDALGTPVAVTDADGNVLQTSEYEPYGKLLNRPLTDGPAYTGHVSDAATGLTYMQQRYYDPGIGRFLSVDPVTADGSGGNFNRYQYASDNPYRFTDPDGRRYKPWTPCNACGEARGPVGAGGTAPGNQAAEANFGAFASSGNESQNVTAGPAAPVHANVAMSALSDRNWLTGEGSLTDGGSLLDDLIPPILNSPEGAGFHAAGVLAVKLGRAGEDAVRAAYAIGGRGYFRVGWRLRISDGLTATTLSEVKNVQSLSFTSQLRDYVDFAKSTGRAFDLYVRPNTMLSGPLVDAVKAGDISLKFIP